MSPTIESLGLDRLPLTERIELAHQLWDSIATESAPELSEAQLRELDRRIAEDDANPDDVVPWEEVRDRLLAEYGR